ncbi:hypothetical protein GCM10010435_16860 [Winogradskya consettensis]|uniref:Glycosyltransferase RgtA/B/C/D-like domain-containing protein n=1 Tax=Winogradskya consettensis TaxID=113560 RepID=A0A919SWQ8_9ACTN|nr:glycosyltransferase family 39 protein [Actinoplanes consettensis]GIM78782.1 hypothetical protein Aco04nite_62190 [Actinoplanes consettensis]
MAEIQVLSPPLDVDEPRSVAAVPIDSLGGGRLPRWPAVLVAVPAALLTLVMTLLGIGSRAMWNDEYATWYASTLSFGDLGRLLQHVDTVVAPYYLFMHGWIALFGDSELSLRLPSALFMAAAAALVALLGRRMFDTGAGVVAGLLFAGIPSVTRYGQEARPYAFAITFAVLSTLLMLRAVDRPSWLRWIGYGLVLVGAAMVHIVTLTILLAHAVYMWRVLRAKDDFRQLRWIVGVVIGITGGLPLAAKGSQQSGAIAWIRADGSAVANMPDKVFGSWQVASLMAGVAVLAAAFLWKRHRSLVLLLLTWAIAPPVFCYLTFPILHLFLHRYLLFTLPAWALLAGAAGYALVRLTRDGTSIALSLSALTVVAGVFYVGLPALQEARRSPVLGEPDFRGAAAAVLARTHPGDGVVYTGTGRNGRRAFGFEGRDAKLPKDVLVLKTSQQLGGFGAQECTEPVTCVGTTRRLWLVSATEFYMDPMIGLPETTQAFLTSAYTLTEFKNFEHVRVFVLNRKDQL